MDQDHINIKKIKLSDSKFIIKYNIGVYSESGVLIEYIPFSVRYRIVHDPLVGDCGVRIPFKRGFWTKISMKYGIKSKNIGFHISDYKKIEIESVNYKLKIVDKVVLNDITWYRNYLMKKILD